MKIVYTQHLKNRLKQRGIPVKIVKEIFDKEENSYFDNLRNHHIIVSPVLYKEKIRKVLLAYDKIRIDQIEAITIHPISDQEIKQRLISGRWHYEEKKQS